MADLKEILNNELTGAIRLFSELSHAIREAARQAGGVPFGSGIKPEGSLHHKSQTDSEQKMNEQLQELSKQMLDNFNGMLGSTQNMLQNLGLMESGFGRIVQAIMQIVNTIQGGFNLFDSIIGLVGSVAGFIAGGPAGAAIGSALRAGGSAGVNHTPVNGFYRAVPQPKVDVVVNTQIEKTGMYKVYMNGKQIADKRGSSIL